MMKTRSLCIEPEAMEALYRSRGRDLPPEAELILSKADSENDIRNEAVAINHRLDECTRSSLRMILSDTHATRILIDHLKLVTGAVRKRQS
jgi:hypothetical protein